MGTLEIELLQWEFLVVHSELGGGGHSGSGGGGSNRARGMQRVFFEVEGELLPGL